MRNFIASYVRSSSACSAARYVSLPNRSHRSSTRRSPARQPATIANRSARFISGSRTLLRITPQHVLLHHPALDDLDRRDVDALLEDRARARRQRPRERPARVHHVTELARPADQLVLVEDRQQHQPVVRVRDRARALERVRGEDHVARVHAAIPVGHHLVDVGAELAHDHAAARVGEHRELVVLLADDRAHRRAEEHRVHLEPRVLQCAFDDVERDRVDRDAGRDLGDPELVLVCGCHRAPPSCGLIRMLKLTSTSAA